MNQPILEIININKQYGDQKNGVHALKNVNLELQKGEILGLLGVNGAGKTTLSSILATLHPATSGEILYQGTSIYRTLFDYRKSLGFCPQKPNLDPYLNVKENLLFAGRYFLLPEKTVQDRAQELMDHFSLHQYADFDIKKLSGGWKQRVLIARALMHKPSIVILDEPTVGLDPDVRRNLWEFIRSLKNMGVAVILTTHYLDEAEALSDRVCILHKGKVLLVESVKDLKAHHNLDKLEDIFLRIVEQEQQSNNPALLVTDDFDGSAS